MVWRMGLNGEHVLPINRGKYYSYGSLGVCDLFSRIFPFFLTLNVASYGFRAYSY